ncbi:hypothetical protein WR25_03907 [Diploscapter pachys]|uniref:C-type lectin domain-containing protein n=1 Tax=Diploscapter pachys TaxID=2018661 RepID=A0A2A2JMY5_9BILA|nr:hypothetical protein WR25_03907 [Diploscapter pachys]
MSTTTTTPDCQAAYGEFGIGWTYWAGDANSDPGCFGVVNDGTVISSGVQEITDFCANNGPAGATPASFHSQAQYDFLTTTTRLGSAVPAWLNLYYDMTTGELMWIDGSPVDYIHAPLLNTDPTTTMQGWFFDVITL